MGWEGKPEGAGVGGGRQAGRGRGAGVCFEPRAPVQPTPPPNPSRPTPHCPPTSLRMSHLARQHRLGAALDDGGARGERRRAVPTARGGARRRSSRPAIVHGVDRGGLRVVVGPGGGRRGPTGSRNCMHVESAPAPAAAAAAAPAGVAVAGGRVRPHLTSPPNSCLLHHGPPAAGAYGICCVTQHRPGRAGHGGLVLGE